MPTNVSCSVPPNKVNIVLGLIEYELNSLLRALHLVDCISVHIRLDLERYLLLTSLQGGGCRIIGLPERTEFHKVNP